MIHTIKDSVSSILEHGHAKAGEHWVDSFENEWVVHEDRDGFWLESSEGNAVIPYWTTYVIQLPGLHRISE